jgi:DNA-binding PadR family transcriptional regulator
MISGKRLDVVFYHTDAGRESVREWLKKLPVRERPNWRSEMNKHIGSRLDEFLEEDGLLAETEAVAIKRVIAWQI